MIVLYALPKFNNLCRCRYALCNRINPVDTLFVHTIQKRTLTTYTERFNHQLKSTEQITDKKYFVYFYIPIKHI